MGIELMSLESPEQARSFAIESNGPEDTQAIGRRLGESAGPGDVFLLVGDLGAGDTGLTEGILVGLG